MEDWSLGWRKVNESLVVWFVLSLMDRHVRRDVKDRRRKYDLDRVGRSRNVVRQEVEYGRFVAEVNWALGVDFPTAAGIEDLRRRWDSFDLWYYFVIASLEVRRRDYRGLGWVMRDLGSLKELQELQEQDHTESWGSDLNIDCSGPLMVVVVIEMEEDLIERLGQRLRHDGFDWCSLTFRGRK